jgi:hypothetical protein
MIRLNPVTSFSYTMETIIQAGNKRLRIADVAIDTNPKTRESRLFKSMSEHVVKSAVAIMRAYMMYKPLPFFAWLGGILLALGLTPFVRFLVLIWFTAHSGGTARHLQSLIVGSVLLIAAIIMFALGVIADLIRINRVLTENTLEQQKRERYLRTPFVDVTVIEPTIPDRDRAASRPEQG